MPRKRLRRVEAEKLPGRATHKGRRGKGGPLVPMQFVAEKQAQASSLF